MMTLEGVICPGCGAVYEGVSSLPADGACTSCGWENGVEPYRLFTLEEMCHCQCDYGGVRMDLFLTALLQSGLLESLHKELSGKVHG